MAQNQGEIPEGLRHLSPLQLKMHPVRFGKSISPRMAAYLAYIMGISEVTDPQIIEMTVMSDGPISVLTEGDVQEGGNYIESWEDLKRNFDGNVDVLSGAQADSGPGRLTYADRAEVYKHLYSRVSMQWYFMTHPGARGLAMAEQTEMYWRNKAEGVQVSEPEPAPEPEPEPPLDAASMQAQDETKSRLALVRLEPGESLKSWDTEKDQMFYDEPNYLPVRQPVLLFTESMELKLRKHDDDRGPEGWVPAVVGDSAPEVIWRVWSALAKELNELGGAVSGDLQTEEQYAHMMSEAADVGNLAMILWDIARREREKLLNKS